MQKIPVQVWQITSNRAREIDLTDQSSLDSISRQLPDGYYSTFRTYGHGKRAIGLKAHFQRLYEPIKNAEVDEVQFRVHLRKLLQGYSSEARVRIMMTNEGQAYIAIEPLKLLSDEIYKNGVRVETVNMTRNTPRLKSTAFIAASEGERKHIAEKGIFEALLVKNGRITEGMTSNFFHIIGGKLYTARRDILLGVTRRTIIQVARGMGLEVRYESLRQDQTDSLDEAFITSSSRGIVPVIQIDNVAVGQGRPGRITQRLSAAHEAYVWKKAEEI